MLKNSALLDMINLVAGLSFHWKKIREIAKHKQIKHNSWLNITYASLKLKQSRNQKSITKADFQIFEKELYLN